MVCLKQYAELRCVSKTGCYRKTIEGSMCTLLTRNAILVPGQLDAVFFTAGLLLFLQCTYT